MWTLRCCGIAITLLTFVQLAFAGDVSCSTQPPALPRNADYLQRCNEMGDTTEEGVPCFTHDPGSLLDADVYPSFKDVHSANSSILAPKDSDLKDFTPLDKRKPFSIRYHDEGVSLHYNPTADKNCYVLEVEKWDDRSEYALEVTVASANLNVLAATWKETTIPKTCEKWVYVHVEDRGYIRPSDGW
ncbi:related to Mig1 protein [Sporisorium scitamineum]|uniref:Related to Mig1 protein n=1 Tax=Sporisorium scitamineum TaxID=49012 RepID=A0A127Z420_9BASI|nr:related to Mig1 protein [Sporisorium scitamineum]